MLNQVHVLLNQCFFLLLTGNNKHPQETAVRGDECSLSKMHIIPKTFALKALVNASCTLPLITLMSMREKWEELHSYLMTHCNLSYFTQVERG